MSHEQAVSNIAVACTGSSSRRPPRPKPARHPGLGELIDLTRTRSFGSLSLGFAGSGSESSLARASTLCVVRPLVRIGPCSDLLKWETRYAIFTSGHQLVLDGLCSLATIDADDDRQQDALGCTLATQAGCKCPYVVFEPRARSRCQRQASSLQHRRCDGGGAHPHLAADDA